MPIFKKVLSVDTWQAREDALTQAYETVANKHNDLGITKRIKAHVSPFYDRPFNVIHSSRFVQAIRDEITSEEVLALPPNLGSIDQFTDSTDALDYKQKIRRVYD